MRGEIAVTEETVKYNKMELSVFGIFKLQLKHFTKSHKAGWYAYKKDKGIYYFKWTDHEDAENIKQSYLLRLKKDGWNVSMSAAVIEDAF